MLNTLKDLLSPADLFIYNSMRHPSNVFILERALKEKLLIDPDFEVWVPLIYYKTVYNIKNGKLHLRPEKIIISNKGKILSLRKEHPRKLKHRVIKGYIGVSFAFDKNKGHILIHRALACVFISPKKDLVSTPLVRLQVNHVNGNKKDFSLNNLEWCTGSENTTHAHMTGLAKSTKGLERNDTKPVKGVVTVGKYKGFEFVLCGAKSSKEQGFCSQNISKASNGTIKLYRNCKWSFATKEEIKNLPKTVPKDILNEIDKFNSKVKSWILGINKTTGEKLIITGGRVELNSLGFTSQAVSSVISGKYKQHKGFYFERIPRC